MSPSKIFNNFFKKMYSKNMSMRTIISFTIVIVTGSTMFGDNNCCEQCCEYLKNCCNKGKVEDNGKGNKEEKKEEGEEENKEEEKKGVEEFYLKKPEQDDSKEIEKLVNPNWYEAKKETASFILYEKIDGAGNQNLNENDVIKVKKDKNGFSIDKDFIPEEDKTKKWALFEIIYKEKKVEEEEGKTVYLYCSDIESTIANERVYGIFYECKQHISISVIACDTSGVTNMCFMFSKCSSLQTLDLSNFDTNKVTTMEGMFWDCKKLNNLDLSNFNTEIVTDMSYMFYNCSSLTDLDLPNFNKGNVEKMVDMFVFCSSLQTVTFNEDLDKNIIEQLRNHGFKNEPQKFEGNKFVWTKKQLT